MKSKTIKFIFSILICHLAGIIGSFFTVSSTNSWYLTLLKPTFNPPSWIFAPVWLTLYTLMGIALYLVWKNGLSDKKFTPLNNLSKTNSSEAGFNRVKFASVLFLIHLVFNALWSIVFFGLHSPFWAFVIILVLLIMIAILMFKFYEIQKWAGYLLIPYFLWVSFATVLNYYIWYLN